MKTPSRKTKLIVDQVYDPLRGWRYLPCPLPLRRLWWRDKAHFMRYVERVHFVEIGDYLVSELGGNAIRLYGI